MQWLVAHQGLLWTPAKIALTALALGRKTGCIPDFDLRGQSDIRSSQPILLSCLVIKCSVLSLQVSCYDHFADLAD